MCEECERLRRETPPLPPDDGSTIDLTLTRTEYEFLMINVSAGLVAMDMVEQVVVATDKGVTAKGRFIQVMQALGGLGRRETQYRERLGSRGFGNLLKQCETKASAAWGETLTMRVMQTTPEETAAHNMMNKDLPIQ